MNLKSSFKLCAQFIFAATVCIFSNSLFAADEVAESANYSFGLPSKDSLEVKWWRDSQTNLDERLAWWRDARFGMFIHWGVYSVPAGTYKEKQVAALGEWIMFNAKIPVAD